MEGRRDVSIKGQSRARPLGSLDIGRVHADRRGHLELTNLDPLSTWVGVSGPDSNIACFNRRLEGVLDKRGRVEDPGDCPRRSIRRVLQGGVIEYITTRRVIVSLMNGNLTNGLDRSQVDLGVTALLRWDVAPKGSRQFSIDHLARGIALPLSHGRGCSAGVGLHCSRTDPKERGELCGGFPGKSLEDAVSYRGNDDVLVWDAVAALIVDGRALGQINLSLRREVLIRRFEPITNVDGVKHRHEVLAGTRPL